MYNYVCRHTLIYMYVYTQVSPTGQGGPRVQADVASSIGTYDDPVGGPAIIIISTIIRSSSSSSSSSSSVISSICIICMIMLMYHIMLLLY